MIYSKKYGYIFIKTRKTAGTSIEIALGKLRGPDDVISAISRDDAIPDDAKVAVDEAAARAAAARGEKPGGKRANYELGYLGAQNNLWTAEEIAAMDEPPPRPEKFWNHMPAQRVRSLLGAKTWNQSFKFCVERNPWDKVLSAYWYLYKEFNPATLDEFITSGEAAKFSCWKRYTHRATGEMLVDRIVQYATLKEELAEISAKLGMPELELPNAKGWRRKDKSHYRDVLTAAQRDRIAEDFSREIAQFGYRY